MIATQVTTCGAAVDAEAKAVAAHANNRRFARAVGAQEPAWRSLRTPCGDALVATALAKRLLRRPARTDDFVVAPRDRAACVVVADALVLKHALGDVAEALVSSSVAQAFAFDAHAVAAVEACRDAVSNFADTFPGDNRATILETIARRGAAARAALGEAPKRPPRPPAWPVHCRPPGIYRAGDGFAEVARDAGLLASKLAVRACSALGADDLEVVASQRIEAGESAPYAGVLGGADLATATRLAPRDQLAFWYVSLASRRRRRGGSTRAGASSSPWTTTPCCCRLSPPARRSKFMAPSLSLTGRARRSTRQRTLSASSTTRSGPRGPPCVERTHDGRTTGRSAQGRGR